MFTGDVKAILGGARVWLIFGGAVLGFVAPWIFAFGYFSWSTELISVLTGCVVGGMVAYIVQRRSRSK